MADISFQSLKSNEAYVKVSALAAGFLTLPERSFVTPSDATKKTTVPSMCFVIEHPRARFMFDLGLRADAKDYVVGIQQHLPNRHPVTHRPSAPEILQANGIEPTSIQGVILSHVHWDHHGDPTSFPNATFYVGHGSLKVLAEGIPGMGSHSHFDPDLFNRNPFFELFGPSVGEAILSKDPAILTPLVGKSSETQQSPVWQSLSPFKVASDLYGDGSVFLIPAPGHLPGHLNLLCRVSPRKWVYLGGDVYHDARLLTGEREIATWEEHGNVCCVHVDREQAMASILRINELRQGLEEAGYELEVIVAHDAVWYEKNKGSCLRV